MTCSKCGQPLPKGSEYCQYCGAKIEKPAKNKNNSKKISVLALVLILFLSVFAVASCGLNIYQYLHIQESSKVIAAKELTLKENEQVILDKETTIKNQNATISEQESTIKSLNGKVSLYDDLLKALNQNNLGHASNQFFASESVIVLNKSKRNHQFALTADFWEPLSVFASYSPAQSPSASVSFDEDIWDTNSTTLTVEPHHKGITTVTFSNDINSQTFKLVILVTE